MIHQERKGKEIRKESSNAYISKSKTAEYYEYQGIFTVEKINYTNHRDWIEPKRIQTERNKTHTLNAT